jgi:2',3'-cyclic-nucleotide 2'-phosphodiesterase (5'-nucleotidase family)
VARRATVIKQERALGGPLLLLDAGDSLTGDQDPAKRTQGASSITLLNMMGYDAIALGPHDLALGLDVLHQRMEEAEFAVLSANAVVSPTGDLVAVPYVLRQFEDHQIAIVGLGGKRGTPEIAMLDPLETAQRVVAEVMPQADVIILLSHAGLSTDQQIADTVPGIDLIISGGARHFYTPWRSAKTGTLILHADAGSPGHAGRRFGVARLSFDDAGQLIAQDWQSVSLGPEIENDPEMTAWVLKNR